MNDYTTDLYARIRERCKQRQWYGPDTLADWEGLQEDWDALYATADGEICYDDLPARLRSGFVRPPLTELW